MTWNENVIEESAEFAAVCEKLYQLIPAKITLSAAAKTIWIAWFNRHSNEQPPDHLRPIWAKATGHCARLALVLYELRRACGETTEAEIDIASMSGGIKLMEYFKSHAHRVYEKAAATSDTGRIAKALRRIKKQGGKVTARVAYNNGFTEERSRSN